MQLLTIPPITCVLTGKHPAQQASWQVRVEVGIAGDPAGASSTATGRPSCNSSLAAAAAAVKFFGGSGGFIWPCSATC